MAHILVLNNYDLEVARTEVAAGRAPDHVLYGLNQFEGAGHTVEVVPYEHSAGLQKLSHAVRRFPVPLGDLDQQRSVLRRARAADLVYCPSQNVAQLLGYLRAAGAFDRPIVWVVHHPIDHGRLRRWRRPVIRTLLGGLDAYPALSTPIADDLAALGQAARTAPLAWGPDASWYPHQDDLGRGVVAAGRTNRDFDTFARGAQAAGVPTWIVCPTAAAPRVPAGPESRVITHNLPYPKLIELYARARAIAIPLHVKWPWPINGLQSLLDALGMGKAVILTRHPWIDIDVERLGIGIWVEPGDAEGWQEAIRLLDDQPQLAAQMGRRARALVDTGERSSSTFARQLLSIFERVLAAA